MNTMEPDDANQIILDNFLYHMIYNHNSGSLVYYMQLHNNICKCKVTLALDNTKAKFEYQGHYIKFIAI